MKIGAKIQFYNHNMREERKRQNISQAELAELTGETITTIQFIETLTQPTLRIDRLSAALVKIASVLNAEYDYLFPEEYLMAMQKKMLPRRTTLIISREVSIDKLTSGDMLRLSAPDENLERAENNAPVDVRKLMDALSDKEKQVIEYLYDLSGENGDKRTLEEAGNHFGVTGQRIRQIETTAFRKMRHPTNRHGITLDTD